MSARVKFIQLDLPKKWPKKVRAAVLVVIAMATIILTRTRAYAANSPISRVRLAAALDLAKTELALVREELRLKDARLARLDPRKGPHYKPSERLAILELRAARTWSLAETARHMLLESATISDWERSLSRDGRETFVCPPQPVNRLPDYVTYLVQRLQGLCPRLGTEKVAQVLARAGLHVGVTTVRRMLAGPTPPNEPPASEVTPDTGLAKNTKGAGAPTESRADLIPGVDPDAKPQPTRQPETTPQPALPRVALRANPYPLPTLTIFGHKVSWRQGLAVVVRAHPTRNLLSFGRAIKNPGKISGRITTFPSTPLNSPKDFHPPGGTEPNLASCY